MDDVRLGRIVRSVRLRLGWRQDDVAWRAGVSQDTVSRIERGLLDALQLRSIRAVCRALQIEFTAGARWRGGDLERLVDEGHATLVEAVAGLLTRLGWLVELEASFNVYGDRGSIDLLAWHPRLGLLLVVEVKTQLYSVEELLRRHDVKVRLAPGIARERFGWDVRRVARLLVLPASTAARRRVAVHATLLARRYALRGRVLRAWLREPATPGGGILFVPPTRPGRDKRGVLPRKRVRTPSGGGSSSAYAPGA